MACGAGSTRAASRGVAASACRATTMTCISSFRRRPESRTRSSARTALRTPDVLQPARLRSRECCAWLVRARATRRDDRAAPCRLQGHDGHDLQPAGVRGRAREHRLARGAPEQMRWQKRDGPMKRLEEAVGAKPQANAHPADEVAITPLRKRRISGELYERDPTGIEFVLARFSHDSTRAARQSHSRRPAWSW